MASLLSVTRIRDSLASWNKGARNPVDDLLTMFRSDLSTQQQLEVRLNVKLFPYVAFCLRRVVFCSLDRRRSKSW